MRIPKNILAQQVILLCKLKEIQHIVISPGSRNAPLTIGFTNDPFFKSYAIVDERCAAFFALGIAQKSKQPVALVCTSGSALLNYYPAIAEAFYSGVPLVILSADRPDYLVGIGDGQTINQPEVYKNHIQYSANLKHVTEDKTDNYNENEINKALNISLLENGPVHINIPFEEPLYDLIEDYNVNVHNVLLNNKANDIGDTSEYRSIWNASKRKMILVGVNTPNEISNTVIKYLASDHSTIVFTEATSNIHHDSFFPSIDKIIASLSEEEFKQLQPDILLTFGGMIVSKKIKAFLRKYQPKHHWHIDERKANNTFFCLSKHFKTSVNNFFNTIDVKQVESTYRSYWETVKIKKQKKHDAYLKTIEFTDLKVFDVILKSIPNEINLQLSNSSTIRYAQLFSLNESLQVYCNRGTSGIDGSTSTAIGSAIVSKTPTVLITGDLSFLYDSNALWNDYIPNDFRIILINNTGGGIFRILRGHKNTKNFDTYFETTHNLTAEHLCKMYNFDYKIVDNERSLKLALKNFYRKDETPKLLEIITPRSLNDQILIEYFNISNK